MSGKAALKWMKYTSLRVQREITLRLATRLMRSAKRLHAVIQRMDADANRVPMADVPKAPQGWRRTH